MASSVENFLKEQSKEYQRHLSTRNRLNQALNHQRNIRLFKTIPKQYLPSSLPCTHIDHPNLTSAFLQKYHNIFFQHLDNIITHNTINFELEEARLSSILLHTEKQLSALRAPKESVALLYHNFLTENSIKNHKPQPDLQKILNSTPHFPTTNSTTPVSMESQHHPIPPQSQGSSTTQKNPKKRRRCPHHKRKQPPKQPKLDPPTAPTPSTPASGPPPLSQPFLYKRQSTSHHLSWPYTT